MLVLCLAIRIEAVPTSHSSCASRLNRFVAIRAYIAPLTTILSSAWHHAKSALGIVLMLFAAHTAQAQCVEPIPVPAAVARAPVVALGEVHGTAEGPAFVTGLLCALSANNRPVVLALELPADEQSMLDLYLSTRAESDLQDYVARSTFWNRPVHDGRSSQAMLALIRSVAELQRIGRTVVLTAFDITRPQAMANQDREQVMADNVSQIVRTNSKAQVVILAGNVHTRKATGTPWDPQFRPMLARLDGISVLSFLMHTTGGQAWVCYGVVDGKPDCGVKGGEGVSAPQTDTRWRFTFDATLAPHFDGFWHVGSTTASLPIAQAK